MTKITIEFFGMLVEATGEKNIVLENIPDTEKLKEQLNNLFPAMKTQNYLFAVNNKLINRKTIITNSCSVACMPPFAGG